MYPFWQAELPFDAVSCFSDRALQVSAADVKADRNITLQLLAVNERRTLRCLNAGYLPQGHLATRREGSANIANRVQALSVLRLPTDREIETPIPFQDLSHCLATNRSLHDRGDISGIQSVSCRRLTVGFDQKIGLTKRSINRGIYDTRNRIDHRLHLIRDPLICLKVGSENLD